MIVPLSEKYLDAVMDVWLQGNLAAHPFIPPAYWHENLESVRQALPMAETYVFVADNAVAGFVGVTDGSYIAGLFVAEAKRGDGIGTALLHHVKDAGQTLYLHVYDKNKQAMAFYKSNGFVVTESAPNRDTGELEHAMTWICTRPHKDLAAI